jgi:hypothetical protein
MIPSTKSQLLVAEDWTKIYQSFRNADFQSYDFDTLRRTMITYLRETYPEEFNDYIDSSEYIALIDLIAYLGQNLSFRIDLNARENFLETAQRRDSVLRLAQLISYNPKRNVPANGLLKISAISTSESVVDTNGINLANQVIGWNDPTNTNWYQQFISIMNSAMPGSRFFGNPDDSAVIGGIKTDQYKINSQATDLPIFSLSKSINGVPMTFEITGATFTGENFIYENPPVPGGTFNYLFRNDNQGAGSANSGFFVHFRQGSIASTGFNITNPVPNEIVGINANGINNDDVWLWQLSPAGTYDTLWTRVEALVGNNIIYNNISNNIRSFYSATTRANDQIDLNFADGSFGDLPKGNFRLFYRQSNGQTYTITPDQMAGINITIPYANKAGNIHQLTLTLSLQYTVTNSSGPESNASIKQKAPQTYYLQNRMITAEDYNIAPLTAGNNVLKVTSINRVSSGISKYFELSDVSGKYSSTDIFAKDGILYKENKLPMFEFKFNSRNEVFAAIKNQLAPIIGSNSFKNFYYEATNYPRPTFQELNYSWVRSTKKSNQTTGYLENLSLTPPVPVQTGFFSSNNAAYITAGALIKFTGSVNEPFFKVNGELTAIADETTVRYRWVKVIQVVGDGTNQLRGALNDGTGPVILSGRVPTGAVPVEVIPTFVTVFSYALETQIANLCVAERNFGLSFDRLTRQWFIILDSNLDTVSNFSLSYQGDTTNVQRDSSWLVRFQWTGESYKVTYRLLEYIFESDKQTAFFVDDSNNNYDYTTDTLVKDRIDVLGINTSPITPTVNDAVTTVTTASVAPSIITLFTSLSSTTGSSILRFTTATSIVANQYLAIHPSIKGVTSRVISASPSSTTIAATLTNAISTGTPITFVPIEINAVGTVFSSSDIANFDLGVDYRWQINNSVVEIDGYVDPKKVVVGFYDANNDGQVDNPDAFDHIVAPASTSVQTGFNDKFVYFQIASDASRYSLLADQTLITAYPDETDVASPVEGELYYFYLTNVVKTYTAGEFVLNSNYFARSGRSNIKFHYIHNSGEERRIDPSKSNIIDIYVLTAAYDSAYRSWLASGTTVNQPLGPTSQSLENDFAATLDPIKSISDTLVFHPASYKVLFGKQASPNLQATFKAVRNPTRTNSDNDLITRILESINQYFSLDNWEFGQSFNFTELSTFVLNQMTPDIINFIIVPKNSDLPFGSLFEIACQSNEILISGTTASDIEIIDSVTAAEINSISPIITNTNASF